MFLRIPMHRNSFFQNKGQQNSGQTSAWFIAWLILTCLTVMRDRNFQTINTQSHRILQNQYLFQTPLITTHYIRLSVYIVARDTQ